VADEAEETIDVGTQIFFFITERPPTTWTLCLQAASLPRQSQCWSR